MTESRMPPEVTRWLNAVERALAGVRPPQRAEIVDGLRAHIIEALDTGDSVDSVLSRLGSPGELAELAAREELGAPQSDPPRDRYFTRKRVVQLASFTMAIVAAATVALRPGYVENTMNSSGEIVTTTTTLALFTMAPAVAAALILAILLSAAPLLIRSQAWQPVSIGVAVLLVLLAAVATIWTVGWFILPAAVLSVIAACLPAAKSRRSSRDAEPVPA